MRVCAVLRRGRAAWKGPSFSVLPGLQRAKEAGESLRTHDLDTDIIPTYVGARLLVHTGRDYQPLTVTDEMVGYKIRAFIRTAKPFRFKGEPMPQF